MSTLPKGFFSHKMFKTYFLPSECNGMDIGFKLRVVHDQQSREGYYRVHSLITGNVEIISALETVYAEPYLLGQLVDFDKLERDIFNKIRSELLYIKSYRGERKKDRHWINFNSSTYEIFQIVTIELIINGFSGKIVQTDLKDVILINESKTKEELMHMSKTLFNTFDLKNATTDSQGLTYFSRRCMSGMLAHYH